MKLLSKYCFQKSETLSHKFTNIHSQQGQSHVGGDCYHTILNPIFKMKSWFYFMPDIGAMAIAPYGFLNIKSLSANLFFMPILFYGALKTAPYGGFTNQKSKLQFSEKK